MSGGEEKSPEAHRPSVYIETTVVSYLTADLSRDIVTLAHQKITREWWEERAEFHLVASAFTVREAGFGDPAMAAKRLNALREVALLDVSAAALSLARALVERIPLPRKAETDAAHIAVAAVNGVDYLLTWNLKHIANPAIQRRIESVCRTLGYEPPITCTPEHLLER